MTEKPIKLKIDLERCKGCMLCVDVCPQKILQLAKEVNKRGSQYIVVRDGEKCTGCGLCVMMCPDCAIEIENN
ncbi:ferredoxin family protein [Candidatus Omnitrophota bacterium]